MAHSRRPTTRAFVLVVAASSLMVASCDDDSDDPADPGSSVVVDPTTNRAEDGGVPLEPGSNLPPAGVDPDEMPDSSGPPATG